MNKTLACILYTASVLFLVQCGIIHNLNSTVGKEKSITKLNLSHQGLTEIPAAVFEMTNLKVLNLHQNKITEIPSEIGNLVNLEKLILSSNKIESIPEEIGYLTKIKQLSLKANNITRLPHSIGQLKQLEILRLGFNNLTELPDEICNLEKLSQIYAEYNKLTHLPDSINKIPLTDLYINQNLINELPISFYSISTLNRLNLTFAGPKLVLDNRICNMWRLETLYIDRGTLTFSPRCLEIRARSNPRFNIILSI